MGLFSNSSARPPREADAPEAAKPGLLGKAWVFIKEGVKGAVCSIPTCLIGTGVTCGACYLLGTHVHESLDFLKMSKVTDFKEFANAYGQRLTVAIPLSMGISGVVTGATRLYETMKTPQEAPAASTRGTGLNRASAPERQRALAYGDDEEIVPPRVPLGRGGGRQPAHPG